MTIISSKGCGLVDSNSTQRMQPILLEEIRKSYLRGEDWMFGFLMDVSAANAPSMATSMLVSTMTNMF